MKKISTQVLKQLYKPPKHSHKGENGRLLVIAGSKKYHGALVLASQMAAKIVDFLYVHTTKENFEIVKKTRDKVSEFIYIDKPGLKRVLDLEADAILIGPGLMPDEKTKKLINHILKKYKDTKILLDAGALRVVDKRLLHKNCVITPHKQEFKSLFGVNPDVKAAEKIGKEYPGVLILKGETDYVCEGKNVFSNTTGNVGMTKGGTGDVLAGLLAGLMTKNDILTASKAAVYLNGKAGDELKKKYGTYYSASELIPQIQSILGRH